MSSPSLQFQIDNDTTLRVLEQSDAEAFYALIENNRAHLRAWLPWLDITRSLDDERSFIASMYGQYLENVLIVCGLWYKGEAAGTISYHPIDWANRKVEIGYWLGASFQGKGLMTKACSTLIDYAFHSLHLNKVEIRCATENRASCAIPQRLGFTQEGLIRQGEWLYDHFVDLFLYGLLTREWRAPQ